MVRKTMLFEEYENLSDGIAGISRLVKDAKRDVLFIGENEEILESLVAGDLRRSLVESYDKYVHKSVWNKRLSRIASIPLLPIMKYTGNRYTATIVSSEDLIEIFRKEILDLKTDIPNLEVYCSETGSNISLLAVDAPSYQHRLFPKLFEWQYRRTLIKNEDRTDVMIVKDEIVSFQIMKHKFNFSGKLEKYLMSTK